MDIIKNLIATSHLDIIYRVYQYARFTQFLKYSHKEVIKIIDN